MAGVIAKNRAIIRSTNARVLVNLISVLPSLIMRSRVLTVKGDVMPPKTTTAVTVITP
jgi:hypothetical protein